MYAGSYLNQFGFRIGDPVTVHLEDRRIVIVPQEEETETAKANGLKPYEYMRYLISELIKYPRENIPYDELEKLMPWSDTLPEICHNKK